MRSMFFFYKAIDICAARPSVFSLVSMLSVMSKVMFLGMMMLVPIFPLHKTFVSSARLAVSVRIVFAPAEDSLMLVVL